MKKYYERLCDYGTLLLFCMHPLNSKLYTADARSVYVDKHISVHVLDAYYVYNIITPAVHILYYNDIVSLLGNALQIIWQQINLKGIMMTQWNHIGLRLCSIESRYSKTMIIIV